MSAMSGSPLRRARPYPRVVVTPLPVGPAPAPPVPRRGARRAALRRWRRPALAWSAVAGAVTLTCFVAGLLIAPVGLALPPAPQSVVLLGEGDRFVASIRAPEIRSDAKADDIPDVMRQAIVAAEDARFLD